MSRTSHYNASFIAIILASAAVHAQSVNDTQTSTRGESLDTLETVGQISYQTGDVINDEETLSSASISQEQLSKTPATLAKIISRETGIQHMQSGGFGSFATVSIRAASAAQTGVYLDGILLNSGGNPVIDLSTLEILNLGSIDIYRGGTPSQLGGSSIGGAVNLNTLRTDDDSPQSRIRFEIGSLSQAGIQASHQLSSGKWDVIAAASRRQSDNDFRYTNTNGTPLNPNDDERQSRENADALRSSGLLRVGYQHSADRRTDITAQLASRELGVPQRRNLPSNQSSFDSDSSQVQLSHTIDNIGGWNSRQSIYRHTDENHFSDLLGQIGLGMQDTVTDTTTEGAKSYWEYFTDSGTLGLSVEYRREALTSNERLDPSENFDANRNTWLASAHYTWYNESETLTLSPAIRWQRNQFRGTNTVGSAAAGDQNNASQFGVSLGLGFDVSDTLSFSSNIGSYYRAPSFGELYGSIGLVNGNPRDELIVTSFDARGVGRPVNSGAARVFGLELGSTWTLTPKLSISSNLTWQSPRSVDSASGFNNNFLPGEAQFSWFNRAEYYASHWTAWYEIDIQNNRFFDRANILPATNTAIHSIGLGWDTNRWEFALSANNLGDDIIEDFNGFPKPGRTYQLLTTYSF